MGVTTQPASSPYLPVRDDWLARRTEAILEPDLPIVDPHHHLWERPGWRYMLDDLLADTNSGHNIVATVFVQCRSMHRATVPASSATSISASDHASARSWKRIYAPAAGDSAAYATSRRGMGIRHCSTQPTARPPS
jgi:predicted TIM-barrel fold metal-dependent hydrolase